MKRLLHTALAAAAFASASAPHAECSVESGPVRARLVELYTSEGCSSCPPAERWLATLRPTAELIPIALHVDYWDGLGWRDRFADARFSARQRSIAARARTPVVYTPQVVIDGRDWGNWRRGWPLPRGYGDPVRLRVTLLASSLQQPPSAVELDVAPRGDSRDQPHVAVTEDALSSTVRAGENRGQVLRHEHVARAWFGPLTAFPAKATLDLPDDLDPRRAAIVAFVEDPVNGRIGQALRLALSRCSATGATP
jgi:hypothetical protein